MYVRVEMLYVKRRFLLLGRRNVILLSSLGLKIDFCIDSILIVNAMLVGWCIDYKICENLGVNLFNGMIEIWGRKLKKD